MAQRMLKEEDARKAFKYIDGQSGKPIFRHEQMTNIEGTAMNRKLLPLMTMLIISIGIPKNASALLTEYDFGDAPDPSYQTLLANDGARHQISDLWLGSIIDSDYDGQPNTYANGDDIFGADDEDGVLFISPLTAGQLVDAAITASKSGYLDAWIDFNHDGDWSDAGEAVFISAPVIGGTNNLHFLVPLAALTGDTYSRFRISSCGDLNPYGEAWDGEVEDYLVNIAPVPLPGSLLLFTSGLLGFLGLRRRIN